MGYLRFLNILSPSISVMYSNPFSISWVASSIVFAVLHVYVLSVCVNTALSMLI